MSDVLPQLNYRPAPQNVAAHPLLVSIAAVHTFFLGAAPVLTIVAMIFYGDEGGHVFISPALPVMLLGVSNGILWLLMGRRVFGEQESLGRLIWVCILLTVIGLYGPLLYCQYELERYAWTFFTPYSWRAGLPGPVSRPSYWVDFARTDVVWAQIISLIAFVLHLAHVTSRLERWRRSHPQIRRIGRTFIWWVIMSVSLSVCVLVVSFENLGGRWVAPTTLSDILLIGLIGVGVSAVAGTQAAYSLASWRENPAGVSGET